MTKVKLRKVLRVSQSSVIKSHKTKRAISPVNGVMIIPPTRAQREQSSILMRRARQKIIQSIGQEAYDKRRIEADEEFERITGFKVRS
ncbi:hypothetical protein EHV15_04075 [Paenibacillus oralis]|uniref:Uncharacterized protein n=1 Tax=Paenibacillus oralis TaxID=2490856 RepID=A0A3P3TVP7_9BACL|nr:hypothetical protein [Paenibacillus oralis]RRJ62217.1 hypothetical protein EHV15_04075 [Paenibacillus oralis]